MIDQYIRFIDSSEKIAIRSGQDSITYRELFDAVDSASVRYLESGIEPHDRVAIDLPRSIEAIIAILASIRINAVYVPLDPRWPDSRKQAIIDSCNPRIVVTDNPDMARVCSLAAPGPSCISGIELRTVTSNAYSVTPPIPAPEDPAYILFTSGSTGIPKGVVVSHRAAHAFLDWTSQRFALSSNDGFANFASFSFDLSVFDIFNAFHAGATLHLIPEQLCLLPSKLAQYVDQYQITVWYSVPWLITSLQRFGRCNRFPDFPLRLILFAGEVFPISDLKQVRSAFHQADFYNLFGPTETNVCTCYELPADISHFDTPVPIGIPCCGNQILNFDNENQTVIVDPGIEGELLVSGPTVMSGYWNDEARTRDAFLMININGQELTFYRTGDRVRWNVNGQLDYLGRRDNLIKRRGFRIELGEIENATAQYPGVQECSVTASVSNGMTRITLWIAPLLTDFVTTINEFLVEKIPEYMLPDAIRFLNRLPRNVNGKIDKEALKSHA